jgi:hypothetical protein
LGLDPPPREEMTTHLSTTLTARRNRQLHTQVTFDGLSQPF